MHLKTSDYLAALAPAVAGITLAQVNAVLSFLSLSGGLAYLVWKWRREIKTPPK